MEPGLRIVCGAYQNAWKKYCYAICLLFLLYIYLVVIGNGQNIKKLRDDIDVIRTYVRTIDPSKNINKMQENCNEMLKKHEKHKQQFKDMLHKELETFGADKTGRTDFALETTGGKIVKLTHQTENFNNAKSLFGITLCEGVNGPRAMLQADMSPGNCWAMKGSNGGVVIKLFGKVRVDAVSLEHISKEISPTGEVSSAPKEFSVWGKNNVDERGTHLGTFIYNIRGSLLQTFTVKRTSNYYDYVEFRVTSNNGNPDFTCIYRFRVHGVLDKTSVKL